MTLNDMVLRYWQLEDAHKRLSHSALFRGARPVILQSLDQELVDLERAILTAVAPSVRSEVKS